MVGALSGPYRSAFDAALPHAKQVADPFQVVRLGNDALDEVCRRVQNQTLGQCEVLSDHVVFTTPNHPHRNNLPPHTQWLAMLIHIGCSRS